MENSQQETGVARVLGLVQMDHIEAADRVLSAVKEGEVSPMEIQLVMKRMEKFAETVTKDAEYKEILLKAVRTLDKGAKYYGQSIQEAIVYTSYDFDITGDPLWKELSKIEKEIKERLKSREEELKAGWPSTYLDLPRRTVVIEKLPVLVWEEVMNDAVIIPPVKKQISGVKVTFAKNK